MVYNKVVSFRLYRGDDDSFLGNNGTAITATADHLNPKAPTATVTVAVTMQATIERLNGNPYGRRNSLFMATRRTNSSTATP